MRTNDELIVTGRRRRRRHSDLFKAEAVGSCQQSGVSVAAVALSRGVNASLLRRWLKDAERSGVPIAIQPTLPGVSIEGAAGFVPVALPENPAAGFIRIAMRRRGRTLSVEWPASAARECALFLQGLIK